MVWFPSRRDFIKAVLPLHSPGSACVGLCPGHSGQARGGRDQDGHRALARLRPVACRRQEGPVQGAGARRRRDRQLHHRCRHQRGAGGGQLECGNIATHTAMDFIAAGLPIKIVALLDVSKTADAMISDGSVTAIKDLKGKQVAYEEGTTSDILLNYALSQNGMTHRRHREGADAGRRCRRRADRRQGAGRRHLRALSHARHAAEPEGEDDLLGRRESRPDLRRVRGARGIPRRRSRARSWRCSRPGTRRLPTTAPTPRAAAPSSPRRSAPSPRNSRPPSTASSTTRSPRTRPSSPAISPSKVMPEVQSRGDQGRHPADRTWILASADRSRRFVDAATK